jgi:tetratricopeptide (TPR) repeat protein
LIVPLATRSNPLPAAQTALVNVDVLLSSVFGQQGDRQRASEMAQEAFAQAQRLNATPSAASHNLLARASFSVAYLTHGVDSIPQWQRTIDLYEAELAQQPTDSNRQRNVALAEKYLGGVLDALDRDAEAEPHYARALQLDEQRNHADPQNRLAQFDLAIDLANMGASLESQDRLAESYTMYARSLEMRRRLSESDPNDVLTRGRLGYVQMRLARLDVMLGRPASGLTYAREAVASQEWVITKTKDTTSQRDAGAAYIVLADAQEATGDRDGACTSYRRARRLVEIMRSDKNDDDVTYDATRAAAGIAACDARR